MNGIRPGKGEDFKYVCVGMAWGGAVGRGTGEESAHAWQVPKI